VEAARRIGSDRYQSQRQIFIIGFSQNDRRCFKDKLVYTPPRYPASARAIEVGGLLAVVVARRHPRTTKRGAVCDSGARRTASLVRLEGSDGVPCAARGVSSS
jgi:hypothetical protein